jgi:hypothetical protein
VDDLVADIDRCAEPLERPLDDLDRPVDAAQKPRGAAISTVSGGLIWPGPAV